MNSGVSFYAAMPSCERERIPEFTNFFFLQRQNIQVLLSQSWLHSSSWNSTREACVVPTPWAFGKRNAVLPQNRKSSMLPSALPATTYVFSSFYSLNVLNEIWYTYTKNRISMHEFLQNVIMHIFYMNNYHTFPSKWEASLCLS